VVLIDTHIWIWWMADLPQLSARYRKALGRLPSPPMLSVISLWEISVLVEQSRVALFPSPKTWISEATKPDAVQLVQITPEVAGELLALPPSLPRDPADRIIAATARALDLPVLTMDRQLLRTGAVKAWSV
jgi:PIN domain nuclease of toxin-antitoxin system